MKFLFALFLFTSTLYLFGQSKELSVKSELRVVIYEDDQYKAWYGQYHRDDLTTPNKSSQEMAQLKKYELKWEKQKNKARAKEQKAKIYHESIIPMEIVFKMNADSLPVPVITNITVENYKDSLITVDFKDITFDNASPEFGNGFCSFRFYFDITNNHFKNNEEGLQVYPKQMGFIGHINFKEGEKSGIHAGYAGNIYSRGEYSIYKVRGQTFSYIPLFYRHQDDFERQLEALQY